MKLLRSKIFIFALVLIILASVIMVIAYRSGGNNTLLGKAAGAVLTPLERAASGVVDWFSGLFGYFYRYSALEEEVSSLKAELAGYRELEQKYWEAVNENEELRKLSRISERYREFTFEPASVISIDGTGYESTLVINKGSIHGVKLDDCVITEEGEKGAVIGYVSEVGPNYARVVTLINLRSKISAIVSRTREVVVAEGDFRLAGQGLLKISYLSHDADIKAGDWIETSGDGKYYPKGFLIGQVTEFSIESHGASSYATVEPVVDLSQLKGVFVIKEFNVSP